MPRPTVPPTVTVTIEIPRWSFVKYAVTDKGGHVDFVSPLPCPFNYGYVADLLGGDQQPQDAIVLGPRLRRYTKIDTCTQAIIRFLDNDEVDDKLVCSSQPLSRRHIWMLRVGFVIYVGMKRIINSLRGRRGRTKYLGIDLEPTR